MKTECPNCPVLKELIELKKNSSDGVLEARLDRNLSSDYQDRSSGFSSPYSDRNTIREGYSSSRGFSNPSYRSSPQGYSMSQGLSSGYPSNSNPGSTGLSYEGGKPGFHGEYSE